jgi:hypothetical protein
MRCGTTVDSIHFTSIGRGEVRGSGRKTGQRFGKE